jgi:hypothetical protein
VPARRHEIAGQDKAILLEQRAKGFLRNFVELKINRQTKIKLACLSKANKMPPL